MPAVGLGAVGAISLNRARRGLASILFGLLLFEEDLARSEELLLLSRGRSPSVCCCMEQPLPGEPAAAASGGTTCLMMRRKPCPRGPKQRLSERVVCSHLGVSVTAGHDTVSSAGVGCVALAVLGVLVRG